MKDCLEICQGHFRTHPPNVRSCSNKKLKIKHANYHSTSCFHNSMWHLLHKQCCQRIWWNSKSSLIWIWWDWKNCPNWFNAKSSECNKKQQTNVYYIYAIHLLEVHVNLAIISHKTSAKVAVFIILWLPSQYGRSKTPRHSSKPVFTHTLFMINRIQRVKMEQKSIKVLTEFYL